MTAPARVGRMYRALVGIGSLCGLLIVSVFLATLPTIEANQAAYLEQAVFKVLPGAVIKRSFYFDDRAGFRPAEPADTPGLTVHAGYDAAGTLVGIAIPGQGMGYADSIRIIYGYAPRAETIIGLQVLASKETPGLGDRIEKDPRFLSNFTELDVSVSPGGQSMAHPVQAVKRGEKAQPWQVEGITGATISSKAIARILRESSRAWVPVIRREIDVFQQETRDGD